MINRKIISTTMAQAALALLPSAVPVRAQSSQLLPIEVRCPAEGSQTYVQIFRRFDGLTIRYLIKYDSDKAIAVSVEVATSDSVFRVLDEIDLMSPEANEERKALAEAVISRNQPAFDAVCRGPPQKKIDTNSNCEITFSNSALGSKSLSICRRQRRAGSGVYRAGWFAFEP